MEQRLPFPVSSRPWSELPESDRKFLGFGDDLPLPANHAAQIRLLGPADGERVAVWAFSAIPLGWPDRTDARFEREEELSIHGCRDDAARRADVQRWLFDLVVPFRRTVYLMYERDRVVETTWRMMVRYWDAFTWSVGYAMVAVDHTLEWACCFHHEDMIIFGTHSKRRRPRRSSKPAQS